MCVCVESLKPPGPCHTVMCVKYTTGIMPSMALSPSIMMHVHYNKGCTHARACIMHQSACHIHACPSCKCKINRDYNCMAAGHTLEWGRGCIGLAMFNITHALYNASMLASRLSSRRSIAQAFVPLHTLTSLSNVYPHCKLPSFIQCQYPLC